MEIMQPLTQDRKTIAADATLLLAEREAMRGLARPEYAAWGPGIAGCAVVELRGARLLVTAGDGFVYRHLFRPAPGVFEDREICREDAVALIGAEI